VAAVTRKSYVDRRLVDQYHDGATISDLLPEGDAVDLPDSEVRLSVERAVCELLAARND
jgi:hypothetical protein